MSKLSDIKGQKISVKTSDPSTAVEGQIWYNSTTHKLKTNIYYNNGTWSSGGNLINSRSVNTCSGGGTQNEAYLVGGYNIINTEEYNGSSWTSGGNISNNRYNQNFGTMGTQNAGLIVSGKLHSNNAFTSATEEYDGTSWSAGGNVITSNEFGSCAGTQNAAIKAKGRHTASLTLYTNKSEIYNGTSWTSVGNCVEENGGAGMTGTQNAALAVGGLAGRYIVEEYDGSVWTSGKLWTGQVDNTQGVTVLGTQNQAMAAGGSQTPGSSSNVRVYDGTTWSLSNDLPAGKSSSAGAGSVSQALVSGGQANPLSTYEYIDNFTAVTKEIVLG